jgi:hypothetical protein
MSVRGYARSMAIGLRLPWSTGCTQGLWTRRLAHEAMGTARVEAQKTAEADFMRGKRGDTDATQIFVGCCGD